MKHYVAGFVFNEGKTHVMLVQKARPDWQKGKLNGVGGHVEPGETPLEAMVREFFEETGITANQLSEWEPVITLVNNNAGYVLNFFRSITNGQVTIDSEFDEPVNWYSLDRLNFENTIFNLQWIIPMLRDSLRFPLILEDIGEN